MWKGLANGIACQQFSLTVGIRLLNRFATLCGLSSQKNAIQHAVPRPEDLANKETMQGLLELPGVGRWTAEYILLRGMGRTNVFPGDDIGARNNLARWLRLRKPLDYERVTRVVSKWKRYEGLIYGERARTT